MQITKFIPNAVSRQVGRQILLAQKNSPKILFGLGIAGALTGTVLACKATLKLTDVLDEMEEEITGVKENLGESDGYHKDLVYVYAKGAYNISRLYAPAFVVGSLSVAALTGSHVTLTRRNAGLTAAYAAVARTLDEYRDRVREELGEEKENTIYNALSFEERKDENGKKIQAAVRDPNAYSMYAKIFDAASPNWKKNAELNRLFVQCQQNYANHLLHSRGHLFLNEVYDMLGLDRSQAGQVVGWTMAGDGDQFVDFGMFEMPNADFINGWERNIILDFNVDGVVWDAL